MRLLLSLLPLLAAPVAAQAQQGAQRVLTDIRLSEALVPPTVVAAWGRPDNEWSGSSWRVYQLATGETLSLLFSPIAPHPLVYADLHSADRPTRTRRLFAHNPRAASRWVSQVNPCRVSEAALRRHWGPPDSIERNGLYMSWTMANGDEAHFAPRLPGSNLSVHRPDGRFRRIGCR